MADSKDPLVYAFWKYDQFPFVLGDRGRLLADGNFKAHGYGGQTFLRKSLIAIYPVELGTQMMERIKIARQAYEDDALTLKEKHRDNVIKILPEMANHSQFRNAP